MYFVETTKVVKLNIKTIFDACKFLCDWILEGNSKEFFSKQLPSLNWLYERSIIWHFKSNQSL